MKRRLTISITFVLALLAVAVAFHQPSQGQTGENVRRSSVKSGLIPLGPNEYLRLTLANAATNPNASDRLTARVNAVVVEYAPNGQQGAVMLHTAVGQTSSGPITLRPGDGASMDFDLAHASRSDVTSFFVIVEALPFAGSSDKAACVATLTKYDKLTNQPLLVW